MKSFSKQKIVPYKAESVYDVVMDIEKYPNFLPWCADSKIIEVISNSNLTADLLINFHGITHRYRSNISHYQDKQNQDSFVVISEAKSSTFKHLFSKWVITKIDDSNCRIDFLVELEIVSNSFLIKKALDKVFADYAKKIVSAFEERMKSLQKINLDSFIPF